MQTDRNALTEGVIWKKLLFFALPILLGNIFQQMYNTADALIVGRFLDEAALAAVTSSGSLIFMMVGFFNGIAMGAGVVIAKYFGAKDERGVSLAVHTDVAFGLVAGVVLTVLGVAFTPTILRWMKTPENVLPNSIIYFRIYFCGAIFVVMYNIFVGILQAVGDSKHPLFYLICSSLLNVVLDLLFVGGFHWGVWSAALATTISQGASVALCLIRLTKYETPYQLHPRLIRFHLPTLKNVIRFGLPSGVQNSIIAFANLVVQSNINTFGAAAMAGCGSYSKVEGFAFLPVTCFAMALATFVSQNVGAGQPDRVRKGMKFGILCSITLAEIVGICVYFLSPYLIAAFNSDPEVVAYGTLQAHTITLFYFLLAFSHCIAGIMRGAGKATVPMFVMLCCWCIIRVTYITIAVRIFPVINTIFWAYPLTWTLSSILFFLYYRKADWIHGFEKK